MAFDKKLLDILACPVCKGKLVLKQDNESQVNSLICRFDRLVYPVRDNIPVLLETEATQVSSDELQQLIN